MNSARRVLLGTLALLATVIACGNADSDRQEQTSVVQQSLEPDESTPIGQKWQKLGAAVVGDATSAVQSAPGGAAEYQTFVNGVIVYSNDFGAFYLTRAIFDGWLSLLFGTTGDGTNLFEYTGLPTHDFTTIAGHEEGVFERGMIIVESGSLPRVVYGDIYVRYLALASTLGLPRSIEADAAGDGRFQVFEHGEIYWKKDVGAFGIGGPILDRWKALGGSNGELGFPQSDVSPIVATDRTTIGATARFEKGAIFSGASSGTWEVKSALLTKYEDKFGGPTGWLGFPISGEGVSGAGDKFNDFEGGVLIIRGVDSRGNPVVYPFGQLDFHLQRVVALGDDCDTCGAQDLFFYLTVNSSDGSVVNNQRFPGSGDFCTGCDAHDVNRDWFLTGAANSGFTVSAAVSVWDNDLTNEDHLGTPSATYSIDNLWGFLQSTQHQNGDGYAEFNIKTSYDFDRSDFRGQMFWSFENFSTDELTYDQMAATFTDVSPDEVVWRHPFNHLFFEFAYQSLADSGNCFGMTLESIYAELGRSPYAQPIFQYFPDTQGGAELTKATPAHASLYNELNVKMGYQLGATSVAYTIGMFLSGLTHNPRVNFTGSLLANEVGQYPLISIFDDYLFGGGHSVRPYDWDPVPGACETIAGVSCVRMHIADPNFPKGASPGDDFIEIDMVSNRYKYRQYEGDEWFGGRMFFQPFALFSHTPMTPFGSILELLENTWLFVVGSTGKTDQISDNAGRTFFEPGLSGPPTRWDEIRRDTASRVPNLAPIVLTDQGTQTMPLQMFAGRGVGPTHSYDVVPAPGLPAGTPVETTFDSGKLASSFSIPGTPGKADRITAHAIGASSKAISITIPADSVAKPITWTIGGPEKQRWAELSAMTVMPGQTLTIRLENGGYHLVIDNSGPQTQAHLRVRSGPGADIVDVGTVIIPSGQSGTEFQLPVTTLTLSGETFGENGWYIAPVTVTLTAKDFSGFGIDKIEYSRDRQAWTTYGAPFVYADEGDTTLYYRARDLSMNLEVAKSQPFKIDTRRPEVTASTDQSVYTRVEQFVVHFSATDPLPGSGLASVLATLDGAPVEDEQSVDLLWLPLGTHTLSVTAKDIAGWTTTQTADFEMIATLQSLEQLIHELARRGEISSPSVVMSLLAHVRTATAAMARGDRNVALGALSSLLKEVSAQSGKHITPRAAELLKADTQYVMAHLP
jgi:hypothetical protein